MQKTIKIAVFFVVLLLAAPMGEAGFFAYGICQSGCKFLAKSCYAAGGFTFGTSEKIVPFVEFIELLIFQLPQEQEFPLYSKAATLD
jgi:hypothetical protein